MDDGLLCVIGVGDECWYMNGFLRKGPILGDRGLKGQLLKSFGTFPRWRGRKVRTKNLRVCWRSLMN